MPKEREVKKVDTRCVCCSIFWFQINYHYVVINPWFNEIVFK
jgi:hypothetical protein